MASLERYRGSLAQPTDVSMLPILLPFAATRMTGVVASLVAMASVLSGTRAAFGATILATAALTVFSGKRSAKLGAWLFTVILATALLGAATAPRRLFSIDTYAHEGRVAQWRAASVLFLESPLIGNGPHVFREQCADRAASDPTSVFAEIDLSSAPYPHQIYLEVLAGSGVLGFLPFVMLLAMPLRSA